MQSIINAGEAYLKAEDDKGREMIIQAIEESGIISGLELIDKAVLWKSQAEDRGEIILKKLYKELYPNFYRDKYGSLPSTIREEPTVTLDKGWLLLKSEFTDRFIDISDFERQCGLEKMDRQYLEEFIKAIWEYEDRLTSVSLTLPNKAGALARIAGIAMIYGNIEDLNVIRNVEGIGADQVVFSFRIETVSEKSAKELQNRSGEMAAWMRKPDFQLEESESYTSEIKVPSGYSILPYVSMLEAFGFTVDSFSRNRDMINLVIKGLTPIEVQMEATQEELDKLWQKIRREINKIQNARMLQIPTVITEAGKIYQRRQSGNIKRRKVKTLKDD